MSQTKETLTQVLTDVLANRVNLSNQLDQQKQQLEIGQAQLDKFDILIASLQTSVANDTALEAIDTQHAANKAVSSISPTGPAANDQAPAAGTEAEAAK
jgi:hypothetical protein